MPTWLTIVRLNAAISGDVVAGHRRPDGRDDEPAAILGGSKTSMRDFEQSPSASRSAQELVDAMMLLHGDRGNPVRLWTAQSVFERGRAASGGTG